MKYSVLSFVLLTVFSATSFAQCMACDAYSEAVKQPSEVRMLQVRNSSEQPDGRLGDFTKLQVLFWENSGITNLPSEVGKLQSLTDLSLAGNQLRDVPPAIYQLKNLKVLNLQGNPIDPSTRERLKKEFAEQLPTTKVFL